jgi:hypothetical protein
MRVQSVRRPRTEDLSSEDIASLLIEFVSEAKTPLLKDKHDARHALIEAAKGVAPNREGRRRNERTD